MDSYLLAAEVVAFVLVVVWLARRRPESGLFAWKPYPKPWKRDPDTNPGRLRRVEGRRSARQRIPAPHRRGW